MPENPGTDVLEILGITIKSIIRLAPNPAGFGDTPDELDADDFVSGIPVQHTHSAYEDDALGLYVGLWDTESMVEAGGPYACDEFMWLLEGECQIKDNKTGATETVTAGTPFVIPKGYDCQWHQAGYLKKYFLISEHPDESVPAEPTRSGVVIPRADVTMTEAAVQSPFAVTSGSQPRHNICYEDTTGRFTAGTWEADAFDSALLPFPCYQLAYVQDGSITLRDADGNAHVFDTGDAFFVPQGVICAAAVTASVRVFFAALKAD